MSRLWAWIKRALGLAAIAAIVGLSVSSSSWAKTVTLTWDPSPSAGVTGYRAFVATSVGAVRTGVMYDAGNALTLTIPGLADTSDHYFCVTAYDDQGNESACSNVVHSPPLLPELDLDFDVEVF